MALAILFLFGLAFVAIVLPLTHVRQLRTLGAAVDALRRQVAALERELRRGSAPTPPPNETPQAAPPRRDLLPPLLDERKLVPPRRSVPPPPAINWEAFMGVKLFAWLGGLALFLGVVFLVKYSFENNLITPFGRIVIGAIVGAGLIAIGWLTARGRYRVPGQSLCATGIVILYADLFAAHSFYGLISLTTAFFAMSAVTLFSFLLAVNLDAQVIVVLGLLGGFITPPLLPSGSDNAAALFTYIALLNCGVAAVALRKRWHYLVLLAAAGTTLTQLGWAIEFFNAAKGQRAFWIFLGFEAQFVVFYFLRRSLWTAAAASLAGLTALGFCCWLPAVPALGNEPFFFFSFAFLADAGLLALVVLGRAHRAFALAAGALTFALISEWILLFADKAPLAAALAAIVIFALLHAATTPASAWRPGATPFTAMGTVTPFLLLILLIERLAVSNPTPVFAVAFILAGILLAGAIVRRADWLAAAALLGAWAVELTWHTERFSGYQAMPALVWYGLFLILFVAFPFCSAQKEKALPWAIGALASPLHFWLFYRAISSAFPNEWMGLLPAAFIFPAAAGVLALLKRYQADPASGDARLAWQGGALLLFVSLIFPLQFSREWITLGWAVEGLALLWLFQRVPHRGLRLVGAALLCVAFARLAFNPAVLEYHRRTAVRILNWYLYAYGVATFCLLAGARLFGLPQNNPLDRAAPPLLASLGTILAFLLLNIETADYFSIGPTLTFSFSGNFARDMTSSIAWALFALGLILSGMQLKQRAARYGGVTLLGVTLAKLFLHDLSDLAELYRIGALVGVATILIAASFIYQRFLAPGQVAK